MYLVIFDHRILDGRSTCSRVDNNPADIVIVSTNGTPVLVAVDLIAAYGNGTSAIITAYIDASFCVVTDHIVKDLAVGVESDAVARVVHRNGILYHCVTDVAYLNSVVSVMMGINVVNDNVFCLFGLNSIASVAARSRGASYLKILNNNITGIIYFNPRAGGVRFDHRGGFALTINSPHELQPGQVLAYAHILLVRAGGNLYGITGSGVINRRLDGFIA